MNIMLWVCQFFLSATFLYSGISKSFLSPQYLVTKGQTGVEGLPVSLIRLIGVIELAGAAGIILPWWLKVLPFLTMASAIGFAVIMLLAMRIHFQRNETAPVVLNVILCCVSLFVAYGRLN